MKSPFERELDQIAERAARIIMNERPDLLLSHTDATTITLKVSRTVRDEWRRLAVLRATPTKSIRKLQIPGGSAQ